MGLRWVIRDSDAYLLEGCDDKDNNQNEEEGEKELERNFETPVKARGSCKLLKAQLSAATWEDLGGYRGGTTAHKTWLALDSQFLGTPRTVVDSMSSSCTNAKDTWLVNDGSWANG